MTGLLLGCLEFASIYLYCLQNPVAERRLGTCVQLRRWADQA